MEKFFQTLEAHPGTATLVAIFLIIAIGVISDSISDIIKSFKR